MRDLLPISHALQLIEVYLQAEISIAELAAASGYSLFHFIRTFDRTVFHTPYNYLMRRRLSAAAHALIHTNRRVIEIALDYRFANHETFSRAFKRLFGMQPVQWRDLGVVPYQALMPPFSFAYLEHIHQPAFSQPEVRELPRRWLAGLMAPLLGQPGEVEQLWRSLGRILKRQPLSESSANYYGVISRLAGAEVESYYLAAVEIYAPDLDLPHLVQRALPAGRYVCAAQPGAADDLAHSLTYLYHTWLPKTGRQPAFPLEILTFGDAPPWISPNPRGLRLQIPVK